MSTLGEKIRELREKFDMTQEELASGICSRAYISIIEKNQMHPSIDVITKLGERLKFDLHPYADQKETQSSFHNHLSQIEELLYNQNYESALKLLQEIPSEINLPHLEYAKWLWQKATLIAFPERNWADCCNLCQEALQILEGSDQYSLKAKIYNLYGSALFILGKKSEAFQTFTDGILAMNKSSAISVRYLVSLNVNLALIANSWREPNTAMVFLKEAEKQNKLSRAHYHPGEIEMQWGIAWKHLREWDNAKKYYLRAEYFFELYENQEKLGAIYTNLGIIERLLGNKQSSLTYLERADSLYSQINFKEKVLNVRYERLLSLEQMEDWQTIITEAEDWLIKGENSSLYPKILAILALSYGATGEIEKAENLFLQSLEIAKNSRDILFKTKKFIYKRLIQFYSSIQAHDKASLYLDGLLWHFE